MTDDRIRAFVAIELPDEVKNYLTRLQQELKTRQPQGVRWVRPEGIHLTLKFLGSVPASLIPDIEAAIIRGCEGAGPFSLGLSHLGAFPSRSRPRVIWIGMEGDIVDLSDLQGKIDRQLETLKFSPESRPFAPHLTLGRVEETISAETRRGISEMVESTRVAPERVFVVRSVSLMKSQLLPGGAVYSRLVSISL